VPLAVGWATANIGSPQTTLLAAADAGPLGLLVNAPKIIRCLLGSAVANAAEFHFELAVDLLHRAHPLKQAADM
jgi:hypothetical protein